jgi:UDP-N-acetylmuramate dehydrogenase
MPSYKLPGGKVKVPAAWLIDHAGWKGRSLGPAAVCSTQALVLVNKGGARGEDIVALCNAVRADVARIYGIEISPEVIFK